MIGYSCLQLVYIAHNVRLGIFSLIDWVIIFGLSFLYGNILFHNAQLCPTNPLMLFTSKINLKLFFFNAFFWLQFSIGAKKLYVIVSSKAWECALLWVLLFSKILVSEKESVQLQVRLKSPTGWLADMCFERVVKVSDQRSDSWLKSNTGKNLCDTESQCCRI